MHFKTLLGAAALAFATAAPASSAQIELRFGGVAKIGGLDHTLTGIQQASYFEYRGFIDTYSVSSATPSFGSFEFEGINLESFEFSFQNITGHREVGIVNNVDCIFPSLAGSQLYAYCTSKETVISTGFDTVDHAKTALPIVTGIPLPAGGLLLLTGLGGLAVAKRRKKTTI